MRAAIYVRVSTANSGQDPTMQTRELVEYCERRGWKVVDEYVDVGISGAKEKRLELDRMVAPFVLNLTGFEPKPITFSSHLN